MPLPFEPSPRNIIAAAEQRNVSPREEFFKTNKDNLEGTVENKQRFLLASGGRDKQVLLYDSARNYEAFTSLDHHASTITSLQFNEYSAVEASVAAGYKRKVELISTSADKNLINKQLDLDLFKDLGSDIAETGENPDAPLFKLVKTTICKDKILSMDVAEQAQYLVTGHDKSLCLWKLPTFESIWQKGGMDQQAAAGKGAAGNN